MLYYIYLGDVYLLDTMVRLCYRKFFYLGLFSISYTSGCNYLSILLSLTTGGTYLGNAPFILYDLSY